MTQLIQEICELIRDNLGFTFASGDSYLKIGELTRGTNGVFAISSPSPLPDLYTPIEEEIIDFLAVNTNTKQAYLDLQRIYDFFHQKNHYETDNYYIYFSNSMSQIDDLDRDSEGRKLLKLSVRYIARKTT